MKRVGSFLVMMLGTAALGVLTGVILGTVLAITLGSRLEGWDALAVLGVGIIFGYPLGIILCQVIAYKWRRYPGSLPLGIAGTILGATAALGIAYLLYPKVAVGISMPAYFMLTPILGTVGYRLKGRVRATSGA